MKALEDLDVLKDSLLAAHMENLEKEKARRRAA
jgi:hypothetical protein